MKLRTLLRLSCWLITICLPVQTLAADNVRVSVLGLSKSSLPEGLESNVENSLSLNRQDGDLSKNTISQLHRQAEKEIRRAMQPFGYYEPEITADLTETDGKWHANYIIKAGPPVIVESVSINITGPGKNLPQLSKLKNQSLVASGNRLHHADYSNLKQGLYDALFDTGYLDVRYARSEMQVNIQKRTAAIFLDLETGGQYFFGDLAIEQTILRQSLLDRIITIEDNTPFNSDQLLDLQLQLTDTGYYSQIEMDIQKEAALDHRIPVVIKTTPAKKWKYSLSGGYGTDTGPRVGFSVANRRINDLGHSAQYSMRLSQVESEVSTQYKIPIGDIYSEYLDVFASGYQEQINDTETTKYEVGTSFNENRWGGRSRISFKVIQETFSFDDENYQVANLVIPGLTYAYKKADNTLFSRDGYSFSFDVHGGIKSALTETTFFHGKANARNVYPLGKASRLLNRIELGYIKSENFDQLPPSERFFTGGSQSVRGYGYKDISPEDENGNLIGGQILITNSIEMDHLFWGNHGAAVFYDFGDAADNIQSIDLKQSVGIGYRYRSPVGMIRIDLAHPFDDPDSNLRLHISIGPDL